MPERLRRRLRHLLQTGHKLRRAHQLHGQRPPWFGGGATDTWQDWMNYFPKCIYADIVDQDEIDRTVEVPGGQDVVEYCKQEADADNDKFLFVGQSAPGSYYCNFTRQENPFNAPPDISALQTCQVDKMQSMHRML